MVTPKQKQRAIKLLKETSLTLREISEETGVVSGTLGAWARAHRPKHVSKNNQYMGSLKGGETTRQLQKGISKKDNTPLPKKEKVVLPTFNDFSEEESPKVVMAFDTETSTGSDLFNFNFSINSFEENISRGEAIARLRSALDILEGLPSTRVSLKLSINKGVN